MNFKESKELWLSNLKIEEIDKPMLPWIYRFNELPYIYTLYSCDGEVDPKDIIDIIKNVPKEFREDIIEIQFHPYIAFVINSKKTFEFEKTIDGLKKTDQFLASQEANDFAYSFRNIQGFNEYFFWFPIGENFDKKIKKVYYECMRLYSAC